jgi:hypothetical protein
MRKKPMALSESVQESLNEAASSLRNALAFAARGERPLVCSQIANLIKEIDHISSTDSIFDMLEDRKPGSSGRFGPFFDNE